MGAVVDEVPHDEGLFGQLLVVEQPRRVVGQFEFGDLGGVLRDPAEAGSLPVGEDRAPRERRDLAHRHGLGKQHRRVGVVAVREVEEPDRYEQRVRVGLLEVRDELRPDDLDEHGLDEPVGAAVLGVHREHDEVPQPVLAVVLGVERDERVVEVGNPEPFGLPALEVDNESVEIRGVMREGRSKTPDVGHDAFDERASRGVVGLLRDAAVVHLQRLKLEHSGFQVEPRGRRDDVSGRGGSERRHVSSLGTVVPERVASRRTIVAWKRLTTGDDVRSALAEHANPAVCCSLR